MASFVYEAVLLFGVVMAAAFGYGWLSDQRHALEGRAGLQLTLLAVVALYYVWCWTHGGQTLPMKTWRMRLVAADGGPVSAPRALWRFVLCLLWFAPAFGASAWLGWGVSPTLWACAAGVVLWAALARLHPQRQFWHDAWAGTRLVMTAEPTAEPAQSPA